MSDDTSAFFGGTLPAVKFDAIGESVSGEVQRVEIRQQSNFESGELQFWPDGRPKMQAIVTLQTDPDDEDDDGIRALYVRGYMQRAFQDAVREAKMRDLTVGSNITVTFTSEGTPPRRGANAPKEYKVTITPAK